MDRDTLSKNVESRETRAQRFKPGDSLRGAFATSAVSPRFRISRAEIYSQFLEIPRRKYTVRYKP